MRICFLSPSGQIGGAERVLLDLVDGLRELRPDWQLQMIVAGHGPLLEEAGRRALAVEALPFPRPLRHLGDSRPGRGPALDLAVALPGIVAYRRRLRRCLAALGPDLIHTNGFKMHLLGPWSRPRGTPVVWHVHDYVGLRPTMGRWMRRLSARVDAAVANSESVAEDLAGVCRDGLAIHTVLNGVDLARFLPTGPALDLDALAALPPAPAATVRVGLVATFGRWKGHETFLRALSLLPPATPVRGYVVGGPVYETRGSQQSLAALRALAEGLGIAARVGFTGFVREPAEAMRALDVVVHASVQPEPFGLVIAEAMACGRAVVASRAGGAAELFREDEDALGHPPGDAAALAETIARLAADPELRVRLGRAARATAERRFDRGRLARSLIPIYSRCTSPGGG